MEIVPWAVVESVALLAAIPLVPYGWAHTSPPVVAGPPRDSPRTPTVAVRACFACQSNGTVPPWYSNIAPTLFASWQPCLARVVVDTGR